MELENTKYKSRVIVATTHGFFMKTSDINPPEV